MFFFLILMALSHGTPAWAEELIIYTEEYPPWSYTQDGEIKGLGTEMVQEIMRRVGKTHQIRSVPWSRGYKAIQEEPNIVLYCTVRSAEREELGLQWVGPLAMLRIVVMQKRGDGRRIESLEDLRHGGAIGVYADSISDQMLRAAGFTNLERVPNPTLLMRMLLAERVMFIMIDEASAWMIAQEEGFDPGEYETAFVYEEVPMSIAFSREMDPAVVAEWDLAFQSMLTDGTARKIRERHLGPKSSPPHGAEETQNGE